MLRSPCGLKSIVGRSISNRAITIVRHHTVLTNASMSAVIRYAVVCGRESFGTADSRIAKTVSHPAKCKIFFNKAIPSKTIPIYVLLVLD